MIGKLRWPMRRKRADPHSATPISRSLAEAIPLEDQDRFHDLAGRLQRSLRESGIYGREGEYPKSDKAARKCLRAAVKEGRRHGFDQEIATAGLSIALEFLREDLAKESLLLGATPSRATLPCDRHGCEARAEALGEICEWIAMGFAGPARGEREAAENLAMELSKSAIDGKLAISEKAIRCAERCAGEPWAEAVLRAVGAFEAKCLDSVAKPGQKRHRSKGI